MDPGLVPSSLWDLTQIVEIIIAKAHCHMKRQNSSMSKFKRKSAVVTDQPRFTTRSLDHRIEAQDTCKTACPERTRLICCKYLACEHDSVGYSDDDTLLLLEEAYKIRSWPGIYKTDLKIQGLT